LAKKRNHKGVKRMHFSSINQTGRSTSCIVRIRHAASLDDHKSRKRNCL
jgi:hypothetical protein